MNQQVLYTTASDGVDIGYATLGNGPPMVKAANWPSHLERDQRSPLWRHWWEELAKDHLLVRYDQRGCGLSERTVEDLSIDALVGDLEAVVDALGLERFPLLGMSHGGAVAIEYAARHPEKVSHLILHGAFARGWAHSEEDWPGQLAAPPNGQDFPSTLCLEAFIPKATREQRSWLQELEKMSLDPESAAILQAEWGKLDVLNRLSQVAIPVLVTHSRGDAVVPFEEGCRVAALIPGARFVPLNSKNHILLEDEPAWPALLTEMRNFLSTEMSRQSSSEGVAPAVELERPDWRQHTAPDGTVTILFSDIQGSTEMTERLGDLQMQEVLRAHNSIVREQLKEFAGFEVKSMGDGFMLAFSSARRALQCAVAMQKGFADYNTEHVEEPLLVRMGLHTGEVMKEADAFFGKHVILASRIANQAEGGQILVSFLFKELTASGGDIRFGEEQIVELKGLADVNRVYPVYWGALGEEN